MTFGHFDEGSREYVITTPDTPYPWINYLGSEDFFSIISNTAGGYSFYRDPRLRRITRYRYNSIPVDSNGRYFYVKDGDCTWNPTCKPVGTALDSYECRHGPGYTGIRGSKNGIECSQLHLVPRGYDGEVIRLDITSSLKKTKTVQVFSFLEFCLWNALDDMTNFQRNLSTGEVEVDGPVIFHTTEYRERRNHYAFYACISEHYRGFDTDRDSFLGRNRGLNRPEAVERGSCGGSICHGWHPVASHCLEFTLAPGERKSAVFILGYAENSAEGKWDTKGQVNKGKARQIIALFDSPEKVDLGLKELHRYWEDLFSRLQVSTPEAKADRIINTWNQYQCITTFNLSRSASLFESGISRGIGFRDTYQDILSCSHLISDRVRRRILDCAALQFSDGSAYHQFQPLTKTGNNEIGGDFNDDGLWMPLAVTAYIKETGDYAILDEPVLWAEGDGSSDSLQEHLRRSFRFTLSNLGPHGLPLIGRGDWNDCLNLNALSENPDEVFQTCSNAAGGTAESVFIAGLFVYALQGYLELCRRLGLFDETALLEEERKKMEQAVMRSGWDGEWYLRAYDAGGNRVGSRSCPEGKIFIEPQGICSMARIGWNKGMPVKALDSVKEHLSTPYGAVLLDPPYSTYHIELGEISSYPEGYKENGAVFCHNNPWIIIGETLQGRGDAAWEYHRAICPGYSDDRPALHKLEPYVYAQMISGKAAPVRGEAKNSWLTGTASWSFLAFTQHILGIRPGFDGLTIDPCVPASWSRFSATRRFRGTTYRITVRNPDHVFRGSLSVRVNGKPLDGNLLVPGKHGDTVEVDVTMGIKKDH